MASTWPLTATGWPLMAYAGPSTATETTLALDSAYTYASLGDAVMWAFYAQESANLTDFWVKVISYPGSWAATDGVINVEVREGFNGNLIPGTTLTGSFTITLDGSTTGWIKKSGLSIALAAGKIYCFVIADADGGATNNVVIARHYTASAVAATPVANVTVSSTAGYSAAGTSTSSQPAFVAKVGSIVYGGGGFTSVATSTNNQVERGMRFKPAEDCTLVGFYLTTDSSMFFSSSVSAIKVYADATNPGGATLSSVAPQTIASGTNPAPSVLPLPLASRVDLTGGQWYRIAFDYSSNTASPRKCTVGGSPDADILSVIFPFNGNCHWIEESGGAWDDSQTTVIPTFGPVLVPKTAAAGGDSGGLVRLNAGFN
jgi:hypothetical protein